MAYVVVRGKADSWPPPSAPDLPAGVWISTLVLVCCSAAIEMALRAIRAGDGRKLIAWLWVTLAGSLAFTASQVRNWFQFYQADTGFYDNLYGFGFFMLTGLHAGHVVGGILAMAVVMIRAHLGHYNWAYYPGVRYTAIYWHFLGFAWLAILAVLYLDT